MSKTPYDEENGKDSLIAHEAAKTAIYPHIFPGADQIKIDHVNGSKIDMEEKIDVFARVTSKGRDIPVVHSIQERWRKIAFSKYRDLTVTLYNNKSGKPAEFYDGLMQYFLYGYYNYKTQKFGEVIFVDFAKLRYVYGRGEIKAKKGNNKGLKNQDFLCFGFDDLYYHDCIEWTNSKFTPPHKTPVADYWKRLNRYGVKKTG